MPSVEEQKERLEAQIQEIRKQIHLSEGQSKAFYEEAENEKKRNRENLNELRKTIKGLHLTLHEASRGSEKAVEEVLFHEKKKRTERSVSGGGGSAKISNSNHAIQLSEYRLHDHIKRLNFLQHKANEKEIRFAKLNQYLSDEGEERAKEQQQSIKNLKKIYETLENDLERISVQVTQSETVKKRYVTMVQTLKGDAATHKTNMDVMQNKLLQEKDVLKNLRECRRGAERTRDDIRGILHQEEDSAFENRREREKKLEEFKKKVDEKGIRDMTAISNRKLSLRSPTQRLSPIPGNEANTPVEKINQEMDKFSQLFSKFKITLGVTTVEEVLDRLQTQKETSIHLHTLRDSTLQDLNDKRKEKEFLQQELHRVKYAATEDSAKSNGAAGELEAKKFALIESKGNFEEELEKNLKVLAGARATLESIAENLQTEESIMKHYTPGSNPLTYLSSLKDFCFKEAEKAWKFIKESEETVIQQKEPILNNAEGEGHQSSTANIRVSLPSEKERKATGPQGEDVMDSGEEEEALARRYIKRQAQIVVETKSRRRNRPVSTFRN